MIIIVTTYSWYWLLIYILSDGVFNECKLSDLEFDDEIASINSKDNDDDDDDDDLKFN